MKQLRFKFFNKSPKCDTKEGDLIKTTTCNDEYEKSFRRKKKKKNIPKKKIESKISEKE